MIKATQVEKDKNAEIFGEETNKETCTKLFLDWLTSQTDEVKLFYNINWRIPHTLFNVSCNYFNGSDIQNVDFFTIYKMKMIPYSK